MSDARKTRLTRSESHDNYMASHLPHSTETPTVPPKSARLRNILQRSASLFERSPFFSIAHATAGDDGDQKAMKIAFYNTAAFVFVGIIFYTCTQVFCILEFCIRPLLWALLLGAVLHPIKQLGKELVLTGIDTLTHTGAPLVLGLMVLPFLTIQRLLYWIITVTIATYKELIMSVLIISIIQLTDMIDIIDAAQDIISYISIMSSFGLEIVGTYTYLIWSIAVGYVVIVCIWFRPISRSSSPYVELLAMPIWALFTATLISYLGQWRDLIAVCVFTVLGCGTYAALTNYKEAVKEPEPAADKKRPTIIEELPMSSTPILMSSTPLLCTPAPTKYTTPGGTGRLKTPGTKSHYHTPATTRRPAKQASLKFLENKNKVNTDKYFSLLGWTVLLTLIGRDIVLVLKLSCFPVIFFLACQLYKFLNLTHRIQQGFGKLKDFVPGNRFRVLFPQSLRGLAILMIKGQNVVLDILRLSTNQIVSASIVLLMILFIILLSCFIFYTVHSEMLYILQATSFYINTHTSQHLQSLNSSLSAWSVGLSSVHSAGRGWIMTKIGSLPQSESTKDLENTLLSVYDNMYQQWTDRNVSSSTRSNVTMNHLLASVKGNMVSLDIFSLKSAKSNLGHLISGTCAETPVQGTVIANYILCSKGMIVDVVNSLWMVFSSNMTLLIKLLFSFASGIVEGGAAFLNFVVQFVVFITALYYLLVYSDHYYAPVEFITSLLPPTVDRVEYTSAFFQATRGIFGASLKLSVFYGCYVWVTHTLFGLEMVFVPALLAGVLSLVPVIGVYWSSVPGFLVLWLVEGRVLRATGFLVLQILPTYVIDMAVYSEIEGGWHPYITGLAVAGGLAYFGLEGAIIGPLVICILKFTINLYECVFDNVSNKTIKEESDSE